jgi:hypothetical protein
MTATPEPGPPQADPDGGKAQNSSLLRRSAIGLAGGGLIAAGVVMLVTPGPGLITIAGGLAVLSKEFTTADKLATRLRKETIDRVRSRSTPEDVSGADSKSP